MAEDTHAPAASWRRSLRAANKSRSTIRSYLDAIARLAAYVDQEEAGTAAAALTRADLEEFIGDQLVRLKPASAANRVDGGRRDAGASASRTAPWRGRPDLEPLDAESHEQGRHSHPDRCGRLGCQVGGGIGDDRGASRGERELLPYAVLTDGRTLGEMVAGGGLPLLQAGSR